MAKRATTAPRAQRISRMFAGPCRLRQLCVVVSGSGIRMACDATITRAIAKTHHKHLAAPEFVSGYEAVVAEGGGLPGWGAQPLRGRPPTSAKSSPPKAKNGPRGENSRGRDRKM